MPWGKDEMHELATTVAKVTAEATLEAITASDKQGKGKGKGKNKNTQVDKGKGRGNSATGTMRKANAKLQQGQWLCKVRKCPWAESAKPNHGFRLRCGGCSVSKGEAMSPAHPIPTRQTAPSTSMRTEEANKKADESKKRAAEAAAEEARSAGAAKSKAEAAATTEPP